jgi:serine/threonine-protein kinase
MARVAYDDARPSLTITRDDREEEPCVAEARRCPDCQTVFPSSAEACPSCASPIAPPAEQTRDQPDTGDPPQETQVYAAAEPSADNSALKFGHYELLRELGRGGMGVVYQARQKHADRLVALKVMRDADHVAESDKLRFTGEVRAMARVSHPHIVAVFEVGEENGCPYFTMEYVDGHSLAQRLRAGPPYTAAESAQWIEDVAGALQTAHDAGILHRDIKPGNILIGPHGEAKLTDFGLAKHLDQDTGLTAAGSAVGTPSYMPPEQARGELSKLGPASDIYALGATFYELLTGRPPFRGETPGGTLVRVLQDDVVPPRKYRPGLSLELEAVCLKCLEKNPAGRYASARELADDLRRWRNGEATKVRPWSWRRRLARRLRRHWKPIAAALFVVVTVAAFLYTLLQSSPEYRARQAMLSVDRAMRSGERVVLVGPTGPPKWSRQVVDIGSTLSKDLSSVFQIDAGAPALIELAPAAHHDHFRLSAELRTRSSKGIDCWSGIYFAHDQGPANPAGFVERLLVVRHRRNLLVPNGASNAGNGNPVNVHDFLLLSREGVTRFASPSPFGVHFYKVNPGGMPENEPWRYLDVEVTPETVRARWREEDGSLHLIGPRNELRNTVDAIRVASLRKMTQWRAKELDEKQFIDMPRRIDYNPRGALGLFVMQAVVDFRNVVYEPLSDEGLR